MIRPDIADRATVIGTVQDVSGTSVSVQTMSAGLGFAVRKQLATSMANEAIKPNRNLRI